LQLSRHCRITDCNQAMISNLDQVKNSTTLTRELFALTMIFRSRCQKQKFQIWIWWFAVLDAAEQRRISRWRGWGGWGGGGFKGRLYYQLSDHQGWSFEHSKLVLLLMIILPTTVVHAHGQLRHKLNFFYSAEVFEKNYTHGDTSSLHRQR
jgi:hypothetical protein